LGIVISTEILIDLLRHDPLQKYREWLGPPQCNRKVTVGVRESLSHNRPMWNRVIKVLVIAAVLAAVMQTIRLLLIEPDAIALLCESGAAHWQCQLRDVVIQGFARHLYGPISIVAVLIAGFSGKRVFAVLAMIFGMAGAVFYDFDLAAVGLLLGALLLVRNSNPSSGKSSGDAVIEQNSPAQ
jgi:hypothetical protein